VICRSIWPLNRGKSTWGRPLLVYRWDNHWYCLISLFAPGWFSSILNVFWVLLMIGIVYPHPAIDFSLLICYFTATFCRNCRCSIWLFSLQHNPPLLILFIHPLPSFQLLPTLFAIKYRPTPHFAFCTFLFFSSASDIQVHRWGNLWGPMCLEATLICEGNPYYCRLLLCSWRCAQFCWARFRCDCCR